MSAEQKAVALTQAGLNAEQAKTILTYSEAEAAETAMTEAEATRLLTQSGLITSTTILSQEELQELATKTGLSEATLEQSLKEAGLVISKEGDVVATQQLNAAELEAKLTSEGAALANDKQTASIVAETVAKQAASKETVKFAGTTNLLTGAWSSLTGVISAHPILAILTAITAGVTLFVSHRKKVNAEIKKIAEEAVSDYQSTISRLSNADEFNDLSQEYAQLSKGVNSLGENIGLTTDEYKKYHDVTNKLAEITPSLVKAWDNQGNAILRVKDNVEDLTDAYKKEQEEANNKLISKGDKILKNTQQSLNKTTLWGYENPDTMLNQLEVLSQKKEFVLSDLSAFKEEMDNGFGELRDTYGTLVGLLSEAGIEANATGGEDLVKILNNMSDTDRANLKAYIAEQEALYNEAMKDRRALFDAFMETELSKDNYNNISDSLKLSLGSFSDVVSNDILKSFKTTGDIEKYIDSILDAFNKLSPKNQKQIDEYINLTTQWNNNELSYDEYIEKIHALDSLLIKLFGDDTETIKAFKIIFDVPDEEELKQRTERFINRRNKAIGAKEKTPKKDESPIPTPQKILGEKQGNTVLEASANQAKKASTDVATNWYNALSDANLKFVDDLSEEDLAKTAHFDSTEQFDKWLEKLQNKAKINVEIQTKSSEGVSDLKKMDDAFGDDLNKVYTTTKTQGGKADAKDIEAVNTAFGGTTFDAKAGEDINLLSSAIESYNKVLVENAGDSAAAQKSVNELATAYVDQSGVLDTLVNDLDHVTEAEKKYYTEQLKAQGITNAEEVVESRLTKQYKAHAAALKELSKYVTQNKTAFDKAVASQDTNSDVIKGMTGQVNDLLAVYDKDGKKIKALSPEIDPSFIIDNAELIQRYIEGDIDAIAKLRVEASKKILVNAEIQTDSFWAEANNLASMITSMDTSDFTVGAYLNSAPFLATLASLQSQFAGTMSEFAKWIAEITGGAVTADYEYETVTVASTGHGYNGAPSDARINVANADVRTLKGIKYKWNGTNTGAGANFGGGGYSGGGGGGNGGGGNADKGETEKGVTKDDKETFDWIEVKIQRLEEAIERLDKKANDTFSSWAKRNKALGNQIAKTTKEIEAQQYAYERYDEYAKNIGNTKGKHKVDKKPKKSDYKDNEKQYEYDLAQYNSANKIWKSGKYQKLVDQGKIRGKDIQKIGNKFLVNLINEYKEWHEKSVQAKDAVQDLQLQLKELNKQKFDNITQQYEDLTTTIEKRVDLIQKKIDRTETKGYFVDESYYKKQQALDKQELTKLITERNKHIAQLNKQTALGEKNGGVDFGSEAWYEMYHQIMDDNAAVEEMRNSIAELDKQIKQLAWDKFDYLREKLDDITAEAEYLQEILSSEKMMDDHGFYNNRGWANAAMITVQYKEAQKGMQEVLAQRKELEKTMDKNSQTDINRWQDLTDKARDYAKAMMAAKDAMKSFVEESINQNLSKLKELMDEYKNAMSAAKD